MNHLDEEVIIPPDNFSMVENGIYRSAFPRSKNLSFLKQLGLRTIIPLVPEELPSVIVEFYEQNGIQLIFHGLDGNKWPFKELEASTVERILVDVLNPNLHPLLIHCNKGKHRTGSVVGCLRKIRGWCLSQIFNEYNMFAQPKSRLEDQIFIESFNPDEFMLKFPHVQKAK